MSSLAITGGPSFSAPAPSSAVATSRTNAVSAA